ncbi:PhzF family phenazine biosynthesis protein [uncultured Nitratireductor sp.]|uniref:PhzF family phenazine biosynthesis protein n=1 Tax=uncultured Nitratireductor sp. TaxID=520953 RepID=UPI0025DE1A80|nr:PhzF family phenazine biosynthesis protein [uncultured Nitratireductor sp.]
MNISNKTHPYVIVDVFAETPLRGNPLAVVPDADRLDVQTMRAIAAEFNLSETSFVLTSAMAGGDFRLRSFTPTGDEVFGAGHNALGVWWWLADTGRLGDGSSFVQQLGEELLPVAIERKNGRAFVALSQGAPRHIGDVDDLEPLGTALGLDKNEPASVPMNAAVVSTGAAHMLVELASSDAVDRAEPNAAALLPLLKRAGAQGCYIYATNRDRPGEAYARFFNPTVGIREDPATGSAAGPLGWLLAKRGIAAWGETFTVLQGVRMGRESRVQVVARAESVELIGAAVISATGQLSL